MSKYDPIICKSTGYFIFVNPAQWLKSQREPKPAILTKMDNNVNNITANTSANVSTVLKKLVIDYDIKTRYFLPRWMEQVGFHLLMKCVNDEHHQLSLAQN